MTSKSQGIPCHQPDLNIIYICVSLCVCVCMCVSLSSFSQLNENYIYIYTLHKNVASNIEQVLAATLHKAPTIQPPSSHHENYPSYTNQTCWTLLVKQGRVISDVLLWTPIYGRVKAGRPARTYIQQLCEDTGCSPEDLPEAMNDSEKWRERVRDIRARGTTWWWWRWWWWYIPNMLEEIYLGFTFPYHQDKSDERE